MNKHYVLAKGAVADLKDIIRHTNDHWGAAQCQIYIGVLGPSQPDRSSGDCAGQGNRVKDDGLLRQGPPVVGSE